MLTLTVSQISRYIKATLEENTKLTDIYIRGEIVGFTRHSGSGHLYLRLTEGGAVIKAVIFRQSAARLTFEPEDGMGVIARGSIGLYERDGSCQFYITELVPAGAGAKALELAKLKEKLGALGVFDPAGKKTLPLYPRRIGVATSADSAAIQDIITVISRRWPVADLVLSPTLVQGDKAPESICAALERLDQGECELIIISRGGGSKDDLSAFDNERVVLAVFECKTPVISAVGHQTDYTLCDFAADARAATPSAAAELATPDLNEVVRMVAYLRERLTRQAWRGITSRKATIDLAAARFAVHSPESTINKCKDRLDIYSRTLYNSGCAIARSHRGKLNQMAARLDALSPLKVLERGYSLTLKDGEITRATDLEVGEDVTIRFNDGRVVAKILEVERG